MSQSVSAQAPAGALSNHHKMASAIRVLAMDGVEAATCGHPGLPLGMADVATVLYSKFLKFDAADPAWPDRDRFVLSAGHGSMLLYALLNLTGTGGLTLEDLKNFRQLGSKTPGHPEYGHTIGVETTTGPLGQGLATAVGMAMAEKLLAAEFGTIVNHYTYVIASDGDLMEGISQEALELAGHLKLSKLIVLFDDNGISIDGPVSISCSTDQVMRFKASGWNALRIDGHDPAAIAKALKKAQASNKPTLIACKTIIGYGAPTKAGTAKAHGAALGKDEIAGARKAYGWDAPPFVVPDDIASLWRKVGKRGAKAHKQWRADLAALPVAVREEFSRRIKGTLPEALAGAVSAYKSRLVAEKPTIATRKSGEAVLKELAPFVPELIVGSADLTESNNTKVASTTAISPDNFKGRFVHWGIREHGMAAACNGMALHGGVIPSGATFLVFSDYCRPALRLAALMGVRAIQVMTHDSIGLGEDGPTHQPVEHFASLRAIPNLFFFRPADSVETLECWQAALQLAKAPSILALSRQNLPAVRLTDVAENLSAKGAYELKAASNAVAQVSLFATGSEVQLALSAQEALEAKDISTRVVSAPCLDLFATQNAAYQASVIGKAPVKIAIEAGVRQGWDSIIGSEGIFIGMSSFGASAPFQKLYQHFGITVEAIVDQAQGALSHKSGKLAS